MIITSGVQEVLISLDVYFRQYDDEPYVGGRLGDDNYLRNSRSDGFLNREGNVGIIWNFES